MPLSSDDVRDVIPENRPFLLCDGAGLYLEVRPTGAKLWKLRYRHAGRDRKISLGEYPLIALEEARERRDSARAMLAVGRDPASEKARARLDARRRAGSTFRELAREYIEKMEAEDRSPPTLSKLRWFLDLVDRDIGSIQIDELQPMQLLEALRRIEGRGHRETAGRVRSFASRVCRYAVVTARATTNPADMLRGALLTPKVRHLSAITDPARVGELLRAIDRCTGQAETTIALQLAPHVYVRPGELRKAEWQEIDWDNAVWRIPGHRMKMKLPHTVPLSRQSLEILRFLWSIRRSDLYLFPSVRSPRRCMSEITMNQALRRIGFSPEEMTPHGFRALATTLLNESGLWHPDAIERSLAHGEKNSVRAAYHRGAHWEERVRMAQWWSDHLDALKANIVPARPVASVEPKRRPEATPLLGNGVSLAERRRLLAAKGHRAKARQGAS